MTAKKSVSVEPDHSQDAEDLIEEARQNVRQDRQTIHDQISSLQKQAETNPELVPILAELILKSVDPLVKANAQIIQLAQLKVKRVLINSGPKDDTDDILAQIESANKDPSPVDDDDSDDLLDEIEDVN
jgi:hypothetical protein